MSGEALEKERGTGRVGGSRSHRQAAHCDVVDISAVAFQHCLCASPVNAFLMLKNVERTITSTPNAAHAQAATR